MIKEFKIPSPGESITEVEVATWLVDDGTYVEKEDEIAEIESDKATLMLIAEDSGKISIKTKTGETVKVGSVAYTIDTNAKKPKQKKPTPSTNENKKIEKQSEPSSSKKNKSSDEDEPSHIKVTPVANKMMEENKLNVEDIINGLKRIGSKEVKRVINYQNNAEDSVSSREINREKMSMLRKKLSQRLVNVKNETAMLTTFNEIDMSALIDIRKKMQPKFIEKHGFKLGFMAFFTKAVSIAALKHPNVNSQIEGDDIISPNYVDVGIAVQTPKGLMVPNVRNTESKSIPAIEKEIKDLAEKARNKKISLDELSGGTISITNGGVFGSMLSTPIINPPQSAILGMHNIIERPVAVHGKVEIRPMMYVALSYDHRLIDGKDSVSFLVKVKELIEQPESMLLNGNDPVEQLLDL